jgi:hypothetical protein
MVTSGPFVIYDHNKPEADSPGVYMAKAKVCNTGDTDLTDVIVHIGDSTAPGTFPPTNWLGVDRSFELLDFVRNGEVDDATRPLYTVLTPGQCECVYWPLVYPYSSTPDLDGMPLSFSVWGTATTFDSAGDPVSVSGGPVAKTVTEYDTLSASANKMHATSHTIVPAMPVDGYAVGQQFIICFTDIQFGEIGSGPNPLNPEDFWYQPVGFKSLFDPDIARLVKVQATLYSSKCGLSHLRRGTSG